MEVAEEDF